jgi:hypothetical protein
MRVQVMQKYIHNRPSHGQGQGMEGRQPPYIALGDHTVLDARMCFSVEPVLYDPEAGIGTNFSALLAVWCVICRERGEPPQSSVLPPINGVDAELANAAEPIAS